LIIAKKNVGLCNETKIKQIIIMGKGDKKSRKGKIFMGSYGVTRPRKKSKTAGTKTASAKKAAAKPKSVATTKDTAKKAAPKKAAKKAAKKAE